MNRKIEILAFDDDELHCEMLKSLFSKYDHIHLDYSTDLSGFFKKIEEQRPDVCLVDYGLNTEDYNGLDVSKFIRKNLGDECFICMLSRHDPKDKIDEYFSYGFNDYFFKPVDVDQVMAKIHLFFNLPIINYTCFRHVPDEAKVVEIVTDVKILSLGANGGLIKLNVILKTEQEIEMADFIERGLSQKVRIVRLIDVLNDGYVYEVDFVNLGEVIKAHLENNSKQIIL